MAPERAVWLHGVWDLAYNPENDDPDTLIFHPDGTVTIRAQHNRVVVGTYAIQDHQLLLALAVGGRRVDVSFEISPDKTRLVYHTGAYYTRSEPDEGSV